MAEIFGAVASGAGLISLSIQLVDSAQKLKALYNASKDAPGTVTELCFELETMSLSLRQLNSHRHAKIAGDELLGRCFITCSRMVRKIEEAVVRIERLIQRRRMAGRLYMAFKEPEIRELLEELERSKSSMSFAYMSYCHSWSLGEAARNVTLLTAQSNALSSQFMQLHDLERTVQVGHSMILDRLAVPESDRGTKGTKTSSSDRLPVEVRHKKRSQSHRKFRVALPQCFIDCVWEFGLCASGNGWEFQLHPVNMRPRDSFVFEVVKSGRVPAVRALLKSGSLSIQDQAMASEYEPPEGILDIAARKGHLELCSFLLDQGSYLRNDHTMQTALHFFITRFRDDFTSARRKADDMYDLFVNRHGLVVSTTDEEHHNIKRSETVEANMLLTKNSLRQILAGQLESSRDWKFELKFPIAMKSTGWPADAFLEFLQPCTPAQLVTSTDYRTGTALHWAAKHFGYWACAFGVRDMCPDETMVKSYAKLLVKLVKMGADVHAVNTQHETPLLTALHQFMTFADWPSGATAVKRWGEIIVEAGLSLSDYVRDENQLLRSLASERRTCDGKTYYMLHPDEAQLVISEGAILVVQIRFCRTVSVWERQIPPGAWDKEPRIPTKSLFLPTGGGDHALFWHEVQKVKIYSAPYLVQVTPQADVPFYSSSDFEDNLRALFKGTQDDHGPVASMISRDRSRSEANINPLRGRASSMPPGTTRKVCNMIPTHIWPEEQVLLGGGHWIPTIYKCLVEPKTVWRAGTSAQNGGTWNLINPRFLRNFDSRSAWERLRAKDDWEVQLLREKSETDAVKRFAHRFCPDLRDQVERELETARSIEDLAQGV